MHKGFAHIIFLVVIVILIITVLFFAITKSPAPPISTQPDDNPKQSISEVSWEFDQDTKTWSAKGNPPNCPDPLIFPSPVDLDLVSGILYPGQIRGGDYKPHGGFRFDNRNDNKVEVRAIMDGYIYKAAKYDDGYDIQISIFFINDCGLMVMHDHLLTLSPKLEEILKDVKVGNDSRTTNISPRVYFKKGELLATEIGYPYFAGGHNDMNVFVDFGLYDLRKTNGIAYDAEFRSKHPNITEYGTYALCWFDYLPGDVEAKVRSLPASGNEGKTSDYCK